MWNNFNSFNPRNPTPTLHNGDVLGPFLRSFPYILLCTPVQVISVSESNGSVNFLSSCKMKSILHSCYLRQILLLTLLVAVKLFQIICCRIGWQLTSDESWNTELKNSTSESSILKILIFYCQQGKGKSWMKTLKLHIIVIEPSQCTSSQINI